MAAIYNEIDLYAAQWLRNLAAKDQIAVGSVIDRGIQELQSKDVRDAAQFHAFAGIGGWSYALRLAGWPDDEPVWTGSCPCQPFSIVGNQKGVADERHLWPEWCRLISECRPSVVFGEQVGSPIGRAWLSSVRTEMEALGYAVGCADLCAGMVGAPHIRQRLYFCGIDVSILKNRWEVPHGTTNKDLSEMLTEKIFGGILRRIKVTRWQEVLLQTMRLQKTVEVFARIDTETDAASQEVTPEAKKERCRIYDEISADSQDQRSSTDCVVCAECGIGGLEVGSGSQDCKRAGEQEKVDGAITIIPVQSEDLGYVGGDGDSGYKGVSAPFTSGGADGRVAYTPNNYWRGEKLQAKTRIGESLGQRFTNGGADGRGEGGGLCQKSTKEGNDFGRRGVDYRFDSADSFWGNVDWIFCQDGKWRPVESGASPLAHGISNRVGKLRAYGNAIVPQVAATFVKAFVEATGLFGADI